MTFLIDILVYEHVSNVISGTCIGSFLEISNMAANVLIQVKQVFHCSGTTVIGRSFQRTGISQNPCISFHTTFITSFQTLS